MRRALVTGVSGGIGAAVAGRLVDDGWAVVGVDRVAPAGELGARLERFLPVDLADRAALDDAVADLRGLDRLDAVVNVAAAQLNEPLVGTSDDDWDRVIDVNLRAPFVVIRGLHDLLRASRGAIVNVSSVHAVATSENVAAYAISKGALVTLTRSAALELGPEGIRCNAVLPGAVDTPMLRDGLGRRPHPDGPEGNLAALVDRTPLGFVATPEQLAETIVHLADGERSPYTTGQAIVVDGGATLRLGTE